MTAGGTSLTWLVQAAGGADGVPFARGRSARVEMMLIHAAPPVMDVEVFENGERRLAGGSGLAAADDAGPIEALELDGGQIARRSVDPGDHIGAPVLLAGGEIGRLTAWSRTDDSWTWSLELRGGSD